MGSSEHVLNDVWVICLGRRPWYKYCLSKFYFKCVQEYMVCVYWGCQSLTAPALGEGQASPLHVLYKKLELCLVIAKWFELEQVWGLFLWCDTSSAHVLPYLTFTTHLASVTRQSRGPWPFQKGNQGRPREKMQANLNTSLSLPLL
jgi:hypothetical protein